MMIVFLLLLLFLLEAKAYVVLPPKSRVPLLVVETSKSDDNAIEASIDKDPYLAAQAASVDSLQHDRNVNEWRSKEAHRHDSLLEEIEHAIDSDPYLAAKEDVDTSKTTGRAQKKRPQQRQSMDKITASIDKDPVLAAQAASVDSLQHDRDVKEWKNKEAHRHDSLLDEIEHSIDNDPTLT